MKNLKVTEHVNTTKVALVGLGMTMAINLTGCGIKTNDNDNNTTTTTKETTVTSKEKNTKEGILVIGDEVFLIEYCNLSWYGPRDQIRITLTDGTVLNATRDNFYEYDKNSETMNKIKQLIIEEDHIIK